MWAQLITSTKDPDQGWAFGELEKAIDSLPPGPLRVRQRIHFDALTLLAVFIQHGDRKRSQQRLVCRGDLDFQAGDFRELPGEGHDGAGIPVLFEHPSVRACSGDTVVTLQDVGATFGGAGQFTGRTSAKIHLKSWASKDVFEAPSHASRGGPSECRGNINVSGSAGSDAGENPWISEAGRSFLSTQFERLTPDHVRAIFETARVDRLGEVTSVAGQSEEDLHRRRRLGRGFHGQGLPDRAAPLRSVDPTRGLPSSRGLGSKNSGHFDRVLRQDPQTSARRYQPYGPAGRSLARARFTAAARLGLADPAEGADN